MRGIAFFLIAAVAILAAPPVKACGADTDCHLTVEGRERTYRIHLPARHNGTRALPALVYHHGYRGSAAGAMDNFALRALADDLGIALIAAKSDGQDWQIPGVPSETPGAGDPMAYADALIADAMRRFPIDPDRIVAAGFSAGGMMVWTLACQRGGAYAAFIPIAGTFWRPIPEACPSAPANLIHIHGTRDRIVPLAGRPIGQSHQGDVSEAMALYAAHGAFGAGQTIARGDLMCKARENGEGKILELCLFQGGHTFQVAHLRGAWQRLEAAGAFD